MTTKTAGGKITGLLALTCEAQEATAVGDAVHLVGDYEVELADGSRPVLGRITVSNTKRISSVLGTSVGNPNVPGVVTVDVPGFFVSTEISGIAIDAGDEVGIGPGGKLFPLNEEVAGTDETYTITRTATSGTVFAYFTGDDFAEGVRTDDFAVIAATTAAEVEAGLETHPDIAAGDVVVTGSAGGPFTVTFAGKYADQNVPLLVIEDAAAVGGTVLGAVGTGGVAGTAVSYIGLALTSATEDDVDVDVLWK